MDARVQRALEEEQRSFERIISESSPPDCIVNTVLELDGNSDFLCQFSTADGTQYAVCVVVTEPACLSWKESRALAEVMRISLRGASMTPQVFERFIVGLRDTFLRIEGPRQLMGVYCGACFPGPSEIAVRDPNTIISTTLSFCDDEKTLVFKSKTNFGSTYFISIILRLPNRQLTKLDCKAIVHALGMLEMGDVLYPTRFFALGLKLRQYYNIIDAVENTAANEYSLRITPTPVHNSSIIQGVLIRAAISYRNSTPRDIFSEEDSSSQSSSSASDDSSLPCPYRGISYRRCLKESGQAQVYVGVRNEEEVAIKVYLDSEEQDDFFRNELKLLLKMVDHPNVVEVYDFFATPKPAIVMEYVEGDDLMDYLSSNPRLSEQEGKRMVLGIAEGLYHLHKSKVIHRDLKSPNIMRRTDGTPVIIDLGLSALLNRTNSAPARVNNAAENNENRKQQLASAASATYYHEETRTGKGSLLWISPEMVLKRKWSDRSDVYAFGIIMWEVFSGKIPFITDMPNAHELGREELEVAVLDAIVDGVRPSMSHVSHIAPYLQETMQMCWHPDPSCRPTMMRVRDILLGNDPEPLFLACDLDRSGYLQFSEFTQFLETYAQGALEPEEVLFLFNSIDTDGDRQISFPEFESFWNFIQQYGLSSFIANEHRTVQLFHES
ncbi:Serine threonine protein kinase-related domain containing protein [Gracilaria domingensis]|nr:Serine threonine protein kinase-related domain containing protein [Gracilaria domingensis]